MNLYLIRHGESESGDKPDEERALTPAGLEQATAMARRVTGFPDPPTVLFSSPLLRARQTAEPFGQGWNLSIQTAEWLRPMVEPSDVIETLQQRSEEAIALVGHLPNLGLLLGTLVWGLPPKEIVIPKGSVAFLKLSSWEPESAKLRWMLTPDTLNL